MKLCLDFILLTPDSMLSLVELVLSFIMVVAVVAFVVF